MKRSPTVSVTAAAVSPEDASSLHWYAGGEAESPSSPPTSRTCCQHLREKRCEHGGGCCCSRCGAAINENTGLNCDIQLGVSLARCFRMKRIFRIWV
nr:hypothetical protein Itr_chr01CG10550 [Ipomoea trifida]